MADLNASSNTEMLAGWSKTFFWEQNWGGCEESSGGSRGNMVQYWGGSLNIPHQTPQNLSSMFPSIPLDSPPQRPVSFNDLLTAYQRALKGLVNSSKRL